MSSKYQTCVNPESSGKVRLHLGYLDGLRAFAAIYVVLNHSFLQVDFSKDHLYRSADRMLQIFRFGHYAVDLFIVLSGFCLMLPVVRSGSQLPGGATSFFMRRARRILPPYYFAMAISLLLIASVVGKKTGTHWDCSIPVTSFGLLTHLLLLQDCFSNTATQINHAFWFISVEWRIYFFFPILVWCWRRVGGILTTSIALIVPEVGSLYLSHLHHGLETCLGSCPWYLGLFALGMSGSHVAFSDSTSTSRWRDTRVLTPAVVVLTGLVAALSTSSVWHGGPAPVYVIDLFVGANSVLLLVISSLNRHNLLTRVLSCKPVTFLGTFAYSIYLIHAPLLQVLWQIVFIHLHNQPLILFAAYTFVGTPIVIAISYLFHLLFEKPFMTAPNPKPKVTLSPAPATPPASAAAAVVSPVTVAAE